MVTKDSETIGGGYKLRAIYAFIRKDMYIDLSYKLNFFLKMANAVIYPIGWFFLAYVFRGLDSPFLEPYGGDFFAFILIGIIFFSFADLSMSAFSNSMRSAQMTGTIEIIFQSPISTPIYLIGSTAWGFTFLILKTILMFGIAILLLGFTVAPGANMLAALLIIFLSVVSGMSIGMIAASFVVLYKQGNPIAEGMHLLSFLFGGVYFPITVFPWWLEWIPYLLPTYYSLDGLRLVLITGASWETVLPHITALTIFTLILMPLGFLIFKEAIRRAKVNGTLMAY